MTLDQFLQTNPTDEQLNKFLDIQIEELEKSIKELQDELKAAEDEDITSDVLRKLEGHTMGFIKIANKKIGELRAMKK